jgi:hypothetical protein
LWLTEMCHMSDFNGKGECQGNGSPELMELDEDGICVGNELLIVREHVFVCCVLELRVDKLGEFFA